MPTGAAAIGLAERPTSLALGADIALLTSLLDDAIRAHDGDHLRSIIDRRAPAIGACRWCNSRSWTTGITCRGDDDRRDRRRMAEHRVTDGH
jgi:hypothetical protein